MPCRSCASGHQADFRAEISISLPGLKGLGKPAVLVFPMLLVCLDCGSTEFTIAESELRRLRDSNVV